MEMSENDCDTVAPLAMVTGATKGIGLAITRMFLERGCRVVGNYNSDDGAAQAARDECARFAENLLLFKADAGDPGIPGAFDLAIEELAGANAPLRYLVANAGVTDRTPFGKVGIEDWERVVRTNLTMPFFLVQHFFPRLESNAGRVIFIGSALAIQPHSVSIPYGVSKAGLHFLAKSLAKTLAPKNITVNAVAPGFVDTGWHTSKPSELRKKIEDKICLRRFAAADEIAAAVGCLVNQPYMTGQVVGIDGGYDLA